MSNNRETLSLNINKHNEMSTVRQLNPAYAINEFVNRSEIAKRDISATGGIYT